MIQRQYDFETATYTTTTRFSTPIEYLSYEMAFSSIHIIASDGRTAVAQKNKSLKFPMKTSATSK